MFRNLPARADSATPAQIILWWEARRSVFNVAVGAVGFLSLVALLTVGKKTLGDQEPLLSPFLLFLGVLVYGVAANICYTAGWIIELLLGRFCDKNTARFGELAFKSGLGFSCLLTSLPLWFVLTIWISH